MKPRIVDAWVVGLLAGVVGTSFVAAGCSSADFEVAGLQATRDDSGGGEVNSIDAIAIDETEADETETGSSTSDSNPVDSGVAAADSRSVEDSAPEAVGADVPCPTHHDGNGGTFVYCAPVGAYSRELAMAAAQSALNRASGWSYVDDPNGAGCGGAQVVAYGSAGCNAISAAYGWVYSGPSAGTFFLDNVSQCGCVTEKGKWD